MSNKKDFPIQIGEKTYLLRYNFDAICNVEDLTGKSFFESLADLQKGKLSNLKPILHAGLKKNHPDIAAGSIGELIDGADDIETVLVSVMDAMNNYFAKKKTPVKEAPAVDSASQTAE